MKSGKNSIFKKNSLIKINFVKNDKIYRGNQDRVLFEEGANKRQ